MARIGSIKDFETSVANWFTETTYGAIVRGGSLRPPRSSFLAHAGRQVSAPARLLSSAYWAYAFVTGKHEGMQGKKYPPHPWSLGMCLGTGGKKTLCLPTFVSPTINFD